MLQTKYKLHRLVNILFYGIVFIGGYILGASGKSIIEALKSLLIMN